MPSVCASTSRRPSETLVSDGPKSAPLEAAEAGAADDLILSGRLHPAVLVLWPLPQLVPLAFLFAAGTVSPRLVGGVLLAVMAAGVVRWLRFRWRVERGSLVVEQGLIARRVRTLPLERIQRVDVVRRLRHRLLGVAELQIEAIGGTSAEGKLDALAVRDAERLRAALLGHGSVPPSQEDDPDELLVATRPRLLLVAGLTGGRVGVVAALLGGVDQMFGEGWMRFFGELPTQIGMRGTVTAIALLVVVAFALSVSATVLVSWDFRLHRDGERLVVRRGLLARREETIPLRRVQALRVEENLVRRCFGLAAVTADLAGGSGDSGGRDRSTLLPIGRRAEAFALAEAVLGRQGLATELTPAPPAALRRRRVRALVAVAVATVAAVVLAGPVGWSALGLLVPAEMAAKDAYRALGRGRSRDVLLARDGLLVRKTSIVPAGHVQTLAMTATAPQRLAGLATVHLQIARSPGSGRGHRWVDIDQPAASTAVAQLAQEVTHPSPTLTA